MEVINMGVKTLNRISTIAICIAVVCFVSPVLVMAIV
jgi:hypothetical protein